MPLYLAQPTHLPRSVLSLTPFIKPSPGPKAYVVTLCEEHTLLARHTQSAESLPGLFFAV